MDEKIQACKEYRNKAFVSQTLDTRIDIICINATDKTDSLMVHQFDPNYHNTPQMEVHK